MDKVENKRSFTVKVNKEDVELCVLKPTQKQIAEGQKVYNKSFKEALESGALLRARLDGEMRSQNIWNDKKQEEFDKLSDELRELKYQLDAGGIKLSEAKKIALKMQKNRREINNLTSDKTQLDSNTVEAQAENSRFNHYVSICTVYNKDGSLFFKNQEDYFKKGVEDYTTECARQLMLLLYGMESNYEQNYPENKFLLENKFVDSKLRLVDNTGRLVSEDGLLIREDGRYVNNDGKLIDKHGRLVDEEGNFVIERKPFLDENDNPIVKEEVKVEEPAVEKKKK